MKNWIRFLDLQLFGAAEEEEQQNTDAAFDALIAQGHTVLIVEHNMEIIKCADWVIDLGPEAGSGGGRIVFEGTPSELAQCKASHTGYYLNERNHLMP